MAKILFDTSVYIPLLRQGRKPGKIIQTPGSAIYLSAVVAQELYAGAGDRTTEKALDQLVYVFQKHERFVAPTASDWLNCGRVLAKIGQKYGYESIKKGCLVNDILIAFSCKKVGAVLLTTNEKDFQTIHSFLSFQFIGI